MCSRLLMVHAMVAASAMPTSEPIVSLCGQQRRDW
jgi:hypothetical protein